MHLSLSCAGPQTSTWLAEAKMDRFLKRKSLKEQTNSPATKDETKTNPPINNVKTAGWLKSQYEPAYIKYSHTGKMAALAQNASSAWRRSNECLKPSKLQHSSTQNQTSGC